MKGKSFDKLKMSFIQEEEDINDNVGKLNINIDEENEQLETRTRQNTFCGTAEYVSPEMLSGDLVDKSADLWAYGCIIYHMFTGFSPFKSKSPFLVFKKIRELDIHYPDSIPDLAKDLIVKLLHIKSENRIGYKDFNDLKSHKFFDIDFNKLNLLLEKCPNIKTKLDLERKSKLEEKANRKIEIIKEGLVEKKSPYLHYNTRKIILDSTPKIEYIDPDKEIVKGVIYLTKECKAEFVSPYKFNLITPKRVFIFKVQENESGIWCKMINEQINM